MKSSAATKLICILVLSVISLSHCARNPRLNDMFCHNEDKAILLQIKSYFGPVGLLSQWDPNTDCDTWPFIGVTGEESPHPGRVTAITISSGTGLSGHLPAVIGNLRYLEQISFSEPNITGPIPKSFSNLKNLRLLWLSSNRLSGQIPEFLGGLNKLQQIDLSYNRFTGSIPASLANLPVLTSLNVRGNLLCGAIPKGLEKFDEEPFQLNKCLCGPPLAVPC